VTSISPASAGSTRVTSKEINSDTLAMATYDIRTLLKKITTSDMDAIYRAFRGERHVDIWRLRLEKDALRVTVHP
jgi:hypothetical protein